MIHVPGSITGYCCRNSSVYECTHNMYVHTVTNCLLQFPDCSDDDAISVACLDLRYHVTLHRGAQRKGEKKEAQIQPVALGEHRELRASLDTEGIHNKCCFF